jgi:DNA-binding transcriptional MerR regulator
VFPRDHKWVEVKAGDIKGMVREIKKLRSENEVNAELKAELEELKAELDEVRSDLVKTQKNLGEEKKRADEAQQSMKALGAGPGGGLQQPPRQSGEKVAEAVESTSLPSTQVLAQLLQTQQQQHQQQLQMHLQMHQQQQQMHQQQQQQMQQRLLELAQQRQQQPATTNFTFAPVGATNHWGGGFGPHNQRLLGSASSGISSRDSNGSGGFGGDNGHLQNFIGLMEAVARNQRNQIQNS